MFSRSFARGSLAMVGPLLGLTAVTHCQSNPIDTNSGSQSNRQRVVNIVNKLQLRFVTKLQELDSNKEKSFYPISWLRDDGLHGGGTRYQSPLKSNVFKQATVNVSSVYFDDVSKYPIDSATALSVIIHPKHPYAPSMHFHISYTEPRKGKAYWRLIADLNPAIPLVEDKEAFSSAIQNVQYISKELYSDSEIFGNKYFYIPSLGRHRGIYHMFVGKLDEDEICFDDSCDLAIDLAEKAVTTYAMLVEKAILKYPDISKEDLDQQIAYHTLYLYQVLTLDRGTTHGLMAHNQNDVGTLGSLPPVIDIELLEHWMKRTPTPQNILLKKVLDIIPMNGEINDNTKSQLANILRIHYKSNIEARKNQADLDLQWWAERTKLRLVSDNGFHFKSTTLPW
jgi:coproporphyrinogen III oxidase